VTLGAADYEALIIADLALDGSHDLLPPALSYSGLVAAVPIVWAIYADKALIAGGGGRLQYLYTERQIVDRILAAWAETKDYEEGVSKYSDNQVSAHWRGLRATIQAEIEVIERRAAANLAPAVGTITATSPFATPAPGLPDPNDRIYRGDAIKRPGLIW
jgi:hypothetical protein